MDKYDFKLDLNNENSLKIISEKIKKHSKVLEFGPASGRLTKYLANSKECTVDIVEINSSAGNIAAHYSRHALVGEEEGDIEKFVWYNRFINEKYDYIVFADVLEHLRNPEKVLRESAKLLNDNGVVLFSVPNIAHGSIILNLLNNKFNYTTVGLLDDTHIRFFTIFSLLEMIERLDMSVKDIKMIYCPVGQNEIDVNYDFFVDLDTEIIKEHNFNNVYQYVFELGCHNRNNQLNKKDIIADLAKKDKVYSKQLESPCLYLDVGNDFSENYKIETAVKEENDYKIAEFNLSSYSNNIVKVRFDPIEGSSCKLEMLQLSNEKLNCIATNASYIDNNSFVFLTKDPFLILAGSFDSDVFLSIKYRLTKLNVKAMLDEHVNSLKILSNQLTTCENQLATCENQLATCENQLATCENQLFAIEQSKAWRFACYLRKIKQFACDIFFIKKVRVDEDEDFNCTRKIIKASENKAKIAVQVHIFFEDLCEEFNNYLNNIPFDFDCFISTDSAEKAETITKVFRKYSNAKNIELLIGPNRGRDVGLFLVQMNNIVFNYNYFCHIHTKKSKHTEFGNGWRRYLLDELLGSKEKVIDIIKQFDTDNKLGIIFPKTFSEVEKFVPRGNNTNNRIMLNRYFKLIKVDIQLLNNDLKVFPVGDMFWGRSKAFTQVFSYPFTVADFPKEAGQLDQTIMHGIERSWVYIAEYNSYHYKILNF